MKKILLYMVLITNYNVCTKMVDQTDNDLELIRQGCSIANDDIIYLSLLANDPIAFKACPLLAKLKVSPYTRCLAQQITKFDPTKDLPIDKQIAAPYQNCQGLKS